MRHAEQSMAVMASLDVDAMTRFEIVSQIDDYVAGFVQRNGGSDLEGEIESLPEELFDYFEAQLATGAFPHLVELTGGDLRAFGRRFVELAQDEDRFERGLARLLDGIARFIAEQTGGGGRQS
jgi:hypothetical protein